MFNSALSKGRAGSIQGGDRLPWVNDGRSDNFATLQSLDWQVHIYGHAAPGFREAMSALNLPLHQFPWNNAAKGAGLAEGAIYLIRPDGHVAFASATQYAEGLTAFAIERGLKFLPELAQGSNIAC